MQGGTCGTENCDGRGLMYSAWPIKMGWVAGSRWMPIWLTNADQLRSAHAEPGSQSNQTQSGHVICGSSVKSVFWIWSLRPGCSKVSWDLWKGTIGMVLQAMWLPDLNIDRDTPAVHLILGNMQYIVGFVDQWEFSLLFKGHWQSYCTALMTDCLPGVRCARRLWKCMYLNQCWPNFMTPYGITGSQLADITSNLTYVSESCIWWLQSW